MTQYNVFPRKERRRPRYFVFMDGLERLSEPIGLEMKISQSPNPEIKDSRELFSIAGMLKTLPASKQRYWSIEQNTVIGSAMINVQIKFVSGPKEGRTKKVPDLQGEIIYRLNREEEPSRLFNNQYLPKNLR